MISKNAKLLLVGLAWLALWPTPTLAQSGSWESYMAAGAGAYAQNDYAEAERQFYLHSGSQVCSGRKTLAWARASTGWRCST